MHAASAHRHHRRPTARGLVWWLRCLVVLVLTLDLVSAPLHRHHHDAGPDAAWLADAAAPAAGQGLASLRAHAEADGQSGPGLFHATTTLRADARAVADDDGSAAALDAFVALLPTLLQALRIAQPPAPGLLAFASAPLPARPVPQSRPPEGRAPPRRA